MVAAAAEVLASGALLPPGADDGPARGSSEVERRRRGCRRSFMSASRCKWNMARASGRAGGAQTPLLLVENQVSGRVGSGKEEMQAI